MKHKWKVDAKPTGRYASFDKRSWPSADYVSEGLEPCAMLLCDDEYVPANVKTGNHAPLTVCIANHNIKPWKWRKLVKTAATLAEAKELVVEFLKQHPSWVPGYKGENDDY